MKKIYVDIDETICEYLGERKYDLAVPILHRINVINELYDLGNEITYWTARGTVTGLDWFEVTQQQLLKWGCKYHNLVIGEKPAYDLLICDKAISSDSFFESNKCEK